MTRIARHGVPEADEDREQLGRRPSSLDVYVGTRMRMRRLELGMSQEKLGEVLGLTFQQVQKYEKGVNRIGAGRLYELAHALGVSVGYFYAGIVADGLPPAPTGLSEAEKLMAAAASSGGIELLRTFALVPKQQRRAVIELARNLAEAAQRPDAAE